MTEIEVIFSTFDRHTSEPKLEMIYFGAAHRRNASNGSCVWFFICILFGRNGTFGMQFIYNVYLYKSNRNLDENAFLTRSLFLIAYSLSISH